MKFSKFNLLVPSELDTYYLFNTLTGNCIEISNTIADSIINKKVEALDSNTINNFSKLGILISNNVDENRIIKYFHEREKFSSDSITSTVLLSWGCNLKCVYCFEGDSNKNIHMSESSANRYIKFLKNLATEKHSKHISLCLFGGEPLINFKIGEHIMQHIKQFCEENGMTFSCFIITNGTLVTADIIEKLIVYNCNMIQITLDGLKSMHDSRRMYKDNRGSFDDIMEALKMLKLKSNQIRSVIRINIDKTNLTETYSLLKFIGREGLNLTNCTVDFGIVRGSTQACSAYSGNCLSEEAIGEVLFDLWNAAEKEGFTYNIRPIRRWIYCGLYSDNQYTVTPDCEVYKCWEHTGQKEHLMGTIDSEGQLVNIQYSFYDWMSNDPMSNENCRECVYLPTCGGGCGVISYNKSNSYHSTGCFKIKGVVEKQVLKYVEQMVK